ncbi:uncharacterized protein [Cardiocondyla obscurior]|uniref:uncharacterized protein n=1 Tax=Cardiocondyla obscurior TaxID=286306 RepID=UPI0039657C84
MAETVVHSNFAIELFDPQVTNWKRWLQRFKGAVTIFKVPETQKVAYLLHFIGSASFDYICDKVAPADSYSKSYSYLTEKLEEYYAPSPLEIAENYRFHQRKQNESETVQQFVAALHKLSINCKFGQYLQTALRNQLVFGLLSKRVQSRLLETKDLIFEKAVEMAADMELTERDVAQLQSSPVNLSTVNQKPSWKKKTSTSRTKVFPRNPLTDKNRSGMRSSFAITSGSNIFCFRCGSQHLATNYALDRNITCRACGIKGHLQKVCKRKSRASTKELAEVLVARAEHSQFREKYYCTVRLEEKKARFEIDSGAAVTVVIKAFAKQFCSGKRIEKSDLQLVTFCKTTIPVIGYVKVLVHYVDAYTKWPEAYITKDLTSYTTIRKCKQIFFIFGFPKIIVSDNGRHFTSNEFATFVKTNGIIHKTTAPFHPATNGQAEHFVQTLKLHLKKKFQTGSIRTSTLEEAVQQILFQYRTTPHVVIDMSPAERMFSRKLRTRLSLLLPDKNTFNSRKHPDIRKFLLGDRVQCRNYYGRTKWIFGRIEKSLGFAYYLVRLDNGKAWKRHVNQILKTGNIPSEKPWDYNPPDYDQHQVNRDSDQKEKETEPKRSLVKVSPARTSPPKLSPSPRRSERPRAPPERYGEIIWH